MIFFHVGALGATAGFANLWSHGGFLPGGVLAVLLTLQIVMFAYEGVELIGVTAGESHDPAVVLPRATNGIIARILIFYLGALLIIMSLVPWTQLDPKMSPFVFVFGKLGVPGSRERHQPGGHHGGRLIVQQRTVQHRAHALDTRPAWSGTARLRRAQPRAGAGRGHPCLGGGDAARRGAQLPGARAGVHDGHQHRAHRHALDLGNHPGGACQLPARGGGRQGGGRAVPHAGGAAHNWLVLAFLVLVTAMLVRDPDTRVALYVAPVWFGVLGLGYWRLVARPG